MREGDNPLYDLIHLLVPFSELPKKNLEALEDEDVDLFFSLSQKRFESQPTTSSAATLGAIQQYLGYEDEAILTLQKGLAINENDASLRLLNLDFLLSSVGFDEVQLELDSLESLPLTAGQYTFLADYQLDCGNEERAIALFKKSLVEGGTITACRTLATLFSNQGDQIQAAKSLERAGVLAPKDKELWLAIGAVWLEAEEWKRAESAFRYCEEIQAPIEPSDWGLCRALMPQGKWEHSLRLLRRCQEWDPENPDYILYEVKLLLEKNPDKGQRRLREFAKLKTNVPEIYLMLADVSEKNGEIDSAISMLDQGLEVIGPNAFLSAAKSHVYRTRGMVKESLVLAEEALEISRDPEIIFNHICAVLAVDPELGIRNFSEGEWDSDTYVEFLEQLALYDKWQAYREIREEMVHENLEVGDDAMPIVIALDLLCELMDGKTIQTPTFEIFRWDLLVLDRISERLPSAQKMKFEPVIDALYDSFSTAG